MKSYFPALDEMARDIAIGHNAWRLYMVLKDEMEIGVPTEIKITAYAGILRLRESSISDALTRLAERGYLAEHPRTGHRRSIRQFTLLLHRRTAHAA